MPYRPEFWPKKDEHHLMGVLDMCLDLHMDANGSSSCLSDENRALYIKCLQWNLRHWWSPWSPGRFDQLVQRLVIQALTEMGACPTELKEPAASTMYVVSFGIGPEGPDGQRQEIDFNFEQPPTKDDIIRAVNKAVESRRTLVDHDKYLEDKAVYGAALLDFFARHDHLPKAKLWRTDSVIRNAPEAV